MLSSAEEYTAAVSLWERGEYARAARHFRNCVADTGAIGVNSIHYLAGCAGELEDGNFRALRGFLQETADEHEDDRVVSVATRYSTHCLTELGLYEDAMAEYDDRCVNAGNVPDSIAALIDYLAVEELANGGHIDAIGGGDIPSQISQLMRLMDEHNGLAEDDLTPETIMLNEVFPNPFNAQFSIEYQVPETDHVTLRLYDFQGRQVADLVNERHRAGQYSMTYHAEGLATGMYIVKLTSGSKTFVRKAVLIR